MVLHPSLYQGVWDRGEGQIMGFLLGSALSVQGVKRKTLYWEVDYWHVEGRRPALRQRLAPKQKYPPCGFYTQQLWFPPDCCNQVIPIRDGGNRAVTVAMLRVVPALKYIIKYIISLGAYVSKSLSIAPEETKGSKKEKRHQMGGRGASVIVMSLVLPRVAEPGR